MPLDKSLQFTPVETGNMTEVPPDLPAGHWNASITVKNGVKDGLAYMFVQFTAQEDLTGENGNYVGSSASKYIAFYPEADSRSKMSKQECKTMSEAWPDLPELDTSGLAEGDWSSLEPWVEALEAGQREIWTTVTEDKQGIARTKIFVAEPGKKLTRLTPAETEEEGEKPKAPAKKTNGKGKK